MTLSSYNPLLLLALFVLTLLVTSLGFRKIVYFVSVGYAFSIVAMGLFTLAVFFSQLTVLSVLHLAALLAWGLRLGFYLVRREQKSAYRDERERVEATYTPGSLLRRAAVWLGVSILYVCMFLPGLANIASPAGGTGASAATASVASASFAWQILGLLVMLAGLILETAADAQKAAFKQRSPKAFCSTGLYRFVRCPNYLGEILFWLGSWVMAIPFYTGAFLWVASLAGLVCIILIMMGSTKRLEVTQGQRYGSQPAYQAYIRTVPVLFPFVPVYSLKNIRVYLE